ncbi:hypothetical protein ACVWZV_007022 [Bradyrhizobium sp. GM5.1]
MVSTLTCITRRYSSIFSSTTLPRLPMPILFVEEVEPAPAVDCGLDQPLTFGLNGEVTAHSHSAATLGLDHFNRAPGKHGIEIGHRHPGAGARQQDRRSPAVADAVARGAATADDRHLASQAGIVLAIFHERFCLSHSTVSAVKKCS